MKQNQKANKWVAQELKKVNEMISLTNERLLGKIRDKLSIFESDLKTAQTFSVMKDAILKGSHLVLDEDEVQDEKVSETQTEEKADDKQN